MAGDAFVREVVAAHGGCPERALRLLASDNDSAVRRAVAANASCPSGTLAGLASDDDSAVRRAVAANASCLSGTLAGLASDDDDGVAGVTRGTGSPQRPGAGPRSGTTPSYVLACGHARRGGDSAARISGVSIGAGAHVGLQPRYAPKNRHARRRRCPSSLFGATL